MKTLVHTFMLTTLAYLEKKKLHTQLLMMSTLLGQF